MKNQRNESRIPALDVGSATILGHPDVTVPCKIHNFSRSGMCIGVEDDITEGMIVKVTWGGNFLVGRAHRVASEETEHRVGLELLYCSKWTEPVERLFEMSAAWLR